MGEEKIATTIRLPIELLEELKKEAQERGLSFNSYVIYLLNLNRQV